MKILKLFINFWKDIWNVIKSMKGWCGVYMKLLLPILLILNIFDYIITLVNRNNFEEANPLTKPIIGNTLALTLLKLVLVPLCIYILWCYNDKPIVKIGSVVLCIVYLYAVTLGVLIYAIN